MQPIGGSIFTHDVLKYDYCIEEAVRSLCAFCSEVVVLDAESTDGTLDLLHRLSVECGKVTAYDDGVWDCAPEGCPGYARLRVLADQARERLTTPWHFMLQADEVVHEQSVDVIREAVVAGEESYICLRVNLYGDMDHFVPLDSSCRPCGDQIVRLARREIAAGPGGDAESLEATERTSWTYRHRIVIFHYGYVRDPKVTPMKAVDVQSWFGIGVDPRLQKMLNEGQPFCPQVCIPDSELDRLKWSHPEVAVGWVEKRRSLFRPVVEGARL